MASQGARPRILVVDDETVIAQLIADMLSGEGYDVDTAPDGRVALARLGERHYDVVLSDLRMPELDGLGFFREIEARHPDLLRHFMFITGTSEHTDYHGFIDEATVPVLTKPFDMLELFRLVQELVAGQPVAAGPSGA
jgi:CheY-like chemotaxis protein